MSAGATCRELSFAGLPATELQLPGGDRVVVAHHGAHVLSWVAQGRERLYLSPNCVMDGRAAIRGAFRSVFPNSTSAAICPNTALFATCRGMSNLHGWRVTKPIWC